MDTPKSTSFFSQGHRSALLNLLVMAIGFAIIGWLTGLIWVGLIGATPLLLGLLSPRLAILLSDGWMRFAMVLGMVNGTMLLTIIFFLVLTPIALISRLFTKDLLQLMRPEKSVFHRTDKKFVPADLKEMW